MTPTEQIQNLLAAHLAHEAGQPWEWRSVDTDRWFPPETWHSPLDAFLRGHLVRAVGEPPFRMATVALPITGAKRSEAAETES